MMTQLIRRGERAFHLLIGEDVGQGRGDGFVRNRGGGIIVDDAAHGVTVQLPPQPAKPAAEHKPGAGESTEKGVGK